MLVELRRKEAAYLSLYKKALAMMHSLTVYFDGNCPICRAEVRFYKWYDKSRLIAWTDIGLLTDEQLPPRKSRDELLGKFHAKEEGSNWHVGVDAFAVIWQRLPIFRRFAWVFRTPGLRHLAEIAYRGFLAWQKRHRLLRQNRAST